MISGSARRNGETEQPALENKKEQRKAIAKQTEEFLAQGGSIESIDPGIKKGSIPVGRYYRNFPITTKLTKE